MGNTTMIKKGAALGFGLAVAASMTACSSSDSADDSPTMASTAMSTTMATGTGTADPAAGLVGSGCAAYAEQVPSGPGSLSQMAGEPLATAVSNNPELTTLASAVSGGLNPQVNLVDTLNGGEFTVFAPTDEAFGKVDPATIESLKTDTETLTSVLTYHVVSGQAAPDQVAGTHKTVEGADLTVTGSGDDLKVNGAGVICGGIKTQNATVYLIDQVLMPPADENEN